MFQNVKDYIVLKKSSIYIYNHNSIICHFLCDYGHARNHIHYIIYKKS